MTIKLDLKDKKILWNLDKDSRQTFSHIGKDIGLSKEAVFYRIKRLEEEKVISGYPTFVSLAKLGLMHMKMLIKLQNIKKEKKGEFIKYLTHHKNTNWVASCRGTYDLIVGFVLKDLLEFRKVKDEIYRLYSDFIHSITLSLMLENNVYGRKYFIGESQEVKHYIGSSAKAEMDRLDFRILKILSANTRVKTTEISSALKESERKIAYRIWQMEKKGVIQKYSISINHEKLGLSFVKAFIYLSNIKSRAKLISYLANQKNCIYNVEALGNWDIEPEFEVSSTEEYYSIIEDIEDRFSDIIKNINTLFISKEHKFVLLPEKISGKFYETA
jgi:Lrp/AsnC family transcriptional regulator, leucine-responsive regulatory protein